AGAWQDERGTNVLEGGARLGDTWGTADGRHMAVGALEPKFYTELLDRLGLDGAGLPAQYDRSGWPELRARLTEAFAGRTQAEWVEAFAGSDACVAPVVSPGDAPAHPHNAARRTFIDVGGVTQPAPAPRFGRTACRPPRPPRAPRPPLRPPRAGPAVPAGPPRHRHQRRARRARAQRRRHHQPAGPGRGELTVRVPPRSVRGGTEAGPAADGGMSDSYTGALRPTRGMPGRPVRWARISQPTEGGVAVLGDPCSTTTAGAATTPGPGAP